MDKQELLDSIRECVKNEPDKLCALRNEVARQAEKIATLGQEVEGLTHENVLQQARVMELEAILRVIPDLVEIRISQGDQHLLHRVHVDEICRSSMDLSELAGTISGLVLRQFHRALESRAGQVNRG